MRAYLLNVEVKARGGGDGKREDELE